MRKNCENCKWFMGKNWTDDDTEYESYSCTMIGEFYNLDEICSEYEYDRSLYVDYPENDA